MYTAFKCSLAYGSGLARPGMVDWGPDVEELVDQLGIESFSVAGHSGGGPHTLAIARHLPDRVPKGVLASPVGDFDDPFMRKQLVMKDLKLIMSSTATPTTSSPPKCRNASPKSCRRALGHVWPGAGHYGFVDRERWIEFVSAVA